jgi:hypothetical protein
VAWIIARMLARMAGAPFTFIQRTAILLDAGTTRRENRT